MADWGALIMALGGALILGLVADAIGRRTRLPRVTILVLLGFLVGPGALDLLPEGREVLFDLAASLALTMVGFLLGERVGHLFSGQGGREVLVISLAVVAVTVLGVSLCLVAAGLPVVMALLLGGIATATEPAATTDVVTETRAKGPFTRLLLGIVAVDDAWGLLVFSLLLSVAGVLAGSGAGVWEPVREGLWDVGGALLAGGLLGVAMAFLTGRLSPGEPTRLEALAFVLLVCGLARTLGVSFILASMVMGVAVALFAKHHERPFHVIERIELPFMIVFFVLAGAALELRSIMTVGLAGACYVASRTAARLAGGWLGGALAGSVPRTRRWIGPALMPQAGVAIGMALVASEHFPEYAEGLVQITIGSTVVFELVGPVVTRVALERAGETRENHT